MSVSPPDLPDLPDFLGIAARVQSVSDLLEAAQAQLQQLESMRIVNGHEASDPIATGGDAPSYRKRMEDLTSGIRALMEANGDISDELTAEAVKRRKARERYHEQDDGLRRYTNTPSP
jgi:hypothetical protein